MIFKLSGLWLHANFRRLWAGQAASLFASELTYVVLPLIAVVFLEATPIQMGIIGAMGGVPALAGIFLGVWVDRRSRGPILVMVDVGRVIVLLAVPVSHVMGVLTIEILYAVSLGIGGMSMLFEIAYRSFLPSVVKNTQIVEANSKLELANTGAVAVGARSWRCFGRDRRCTVCSDIEHDHVCDICPDVQISPSERSRC